MGLAPEESDESRGSLLEWSLVLYGSNLTIQDISYRRKLMNDAINSQDITSSLSCPPHPTNLEDITFPDSPLGNKFLKILSALALVIVSILFLHLLLTYIYRKVKEKRSYRAALPSIHFNRHSTSTAGDEEEVLLLETTSVDKDNETKDPWNDTDHDTTNQTEPNNTSV
jgi:proprotein convertase subtilisin/kexin type 7